MSTPRFAFAGDRDIAVWVLKYILEQGQKPVCLLLSEVARASHARELRSLCSFLKEEDILTGKEFREPAGIRKLRELDLHYIVGIHFPYLVPSEVLSIPRIGFLNLHPAFLRYNRGWHTPSWAILEGTPAGATLHFMDSGVDTGDIIHQRALEVSEGDTADSLYKRLKELEVEVFKEAWPALMDQSFRRTAQKESEGTVHKRKDLFAEKVQRIDLDSSIKIRDLIRRLRALTTNQVEEAAYYEDNGKCFRVQLTITQQPDE